MAKALIILGIALVLAGLSWPWLKQLPLGRLPGDILIRGEHGMLYIPLASGLLVSVVVSGVLWWLNR